MKKKYTEFTDKERKAIYERDDYKCVIPNCNNNFGLGIAHVFVSRAKGGKGVRQNGVLLCQHHHHILDNGHNAKEQEKIDGFVRYYLFRLYPDVKLQDLKFDKWEMYAIKG